MKDFGIHSGLMIPPGSRAVLARIDPADTYGVTQAHVARRFAKQEAVLAGLQEKLFAENRRSLLVVLQATDTGGKDGTVKHVIGGVNPQGVRITSFKVPTPEERRHEFLWRIRRALTVPGQIGIFNRSHYEDVLVARVKHVVPFDTVEARYGEINAFETELTDSGTTVLKFFLHISYEEQRKRLLERLNDPDKNWKFTESDIEERQYWEDYQSAYDAALTRCSSRTAPWYVIPANHKWFRNWAVMEILIATLKAMKPEYPHPKLDIPRLKQRLAG
jgi:PPK2 family polyphosphate:nucleotide phosphotransferase